MKVSNVKLHMNRKSVITYMVAILAVFLLLTIIVAVSTKNDLAQINSFMHSNYVYSASSSNSVADDSYLQYDAGISFSLSSEVSSDLNAEIVMQTANSQYTDLLHWNTERLSEHGIAISENIASDNEINIGDKLYSKSIVNGEVHEYTVETILPTIIYTRGLEKPFRADGVIVMGYDNQYASNITHRYIIFTSVPIEDLLLQCSSTPYDIVYREDEIASSFGSIAPYMAVYFLLAAGSIVIFVVQFVNKIAHNYRRLIMLGFEKRALSGAYYCTIGKAVFLVIIINAVISTVAFVDSAICATTIAPVVCVLVVELVAAITTMTILNKRLWRE